jgi:hypothetical protein
MLEAAIAATGFCVFGFFARMFDAVGSEQDNFACTIFSWPLGALAVYCLVRFVFWGMDDPYAVRGFPLILAGASTPRRHRLHGLKNGLPCIASPGVKK